MWVLNSGRITLLGYICVTSKDQKLTSQKDALREHGCDKIYTDKVSGAKAERPGLDRMLRNAREGDTIVVWKLDRLGRSLKHLVELAEELNQRGIGLKSLNDPIDTRTAQGKLVFNIFAALAEFERGIIRERTNAGFSAARARGRMGGRRPGLSEDAKRKARVAESFYKEGMPVNQIAEDLNISKATLYKYLRYRNVEIGKYEKQSS